MASPVGNPYQAVITAIQTGQPGEHVYALVTHLLAKKTDLLQLRQLEADISVLKSSDPEHDPTPAEKVATFAHALIHTAHLKEMSTLSQNNKEHFLALLQQIDDPETRLELALMMSTSFEPHDIEYYRIENEHDRLRVARAHLPVERIGDATLQDYQTTLEIFNIKSEKERCDLLCYFIKLFNKISIQRILSSFSDLDIHEKETRTSIACACVAQAPDLICDVVNQLQLAEDQVKTLIDSILREGTYSGMSALIEHLHTLNISDEATRRMIALTIAEKSPLLLFPHIEGLNLDLESRILIAHHLAQGGSGAQLLEYFQDFAIDDEAISFEILRKIEPRYLDCWLLNRNDYPISKPEFRYELYKNFAKCNLVSLSQQIAKEPNEEERTLMTQAGAETNPISLILNYSPRFNLSEASAIKVAEVIARFHPTVLFNFLERAFLDFQIGVRLLQQYPSPSLDCFKAILVWHQRKLLSSEQLEEILRPCIKKESRMTAKHLNLFVNALNKKILFELATLCARNSLPPNLNGADLQLCEAIVKEANGYPDITLVLELFERFFISLTPYRLKIYHRLVSKPNEPPIAHLLLPMMMVALWVELNQLPVDDSLNQLPSYLSIKPLRKHFRNTGSTLQKLWLNVLRMFDHDPILAERKNYPVVLLLLTQITQGLDREDPAKDFICRLGTLQGIMNARPIEASKDSISPLIESLVDQILDAADPTQTTPFLKRAFEEALVSDPYLNLANIEDLSTKYASTFGDTRIPNALQIYENSLKASHDPTVQAPFNDFIYVVLNGTY